MRLEVDEFIRRFLLHVLPDGFHRIRHYGFLARGDRCENLERCRKLIGEATPAQTAASLGSAAEKTAASEAAASQSVCPDCGGFMRRIGDVPPCRPGPFRCDTS